MTIRKILFRLLILFFLLPHSFPSAAREVPSAMGTSDSLDQEPLSPVQQRVREGLDTLRVKRYFTDKDIRDYLYGEFTDFYASRAYQLAWYAANEPYGAVHELEEALSAASAEGLAFDYRPDTLRWLRESLFGEPEGRLGELVRLDFLTTAAYLTYASHLLSGVLDPGRYDRSWTAQPRSRHLAGHLQAALRTGTVRESLQQLVPRHRQYHRLREALARYRDIAEGGGWPVLPAGLVLRKGDTSDVVPRLRRRLMISGDLAAPANPAAMGSTSGDQAGTADPARSQPGETDPATILDEEVAAALAHYQARSGLVADSVLGPNTRRMLNVPVHRRIRQIELNMERLRWWPESFGEKYVLVNVPDYRLRVYEDGVKKLEMKVVVGKDYHSTPLFRDTIRYIVFSPTWTVPRSIAVNEMLPALRKNPGYLRRNHMKLYRAGAVKAGQEIDPFTVDWAEASADHFPYRIVQQPGTHNALGQVKFMFPNQRAIYLHDTPRGHLFSRKRRAYSHGCVRVENPVDLAAYLLEGDPAWDRQRIRKSMYLDRPVATRLPELVPVQFLYQTAFVDAQGRMHFREDVYGHDRKQMDALPQ